MSTATQTPPAVEPAESVEQRERGADRRQRPTSFWGPFWGPRRRRHGRRAGEDVDIYVDIFNARDVLFAALIFSLNIADAIFTLVYLEHGAAEANPIMNWVLGLGYTAFLFEKLFVVGFFIVFLMMHKKFWVARLGLTTLLVLYSGVVAYHIYLQTVQPTPVPLETFEPFGPAMLP